VRRVNPPFFTDDTGQDLIEYALLCALLSLAVLGILPHTSRPISDTYARIRSTMQVVVYECDDDPPGTDDPRSQCP
jgi:Flp pilus assembly pilin Flp